MKFSLYASALALASTAIAAPAIEERGLKCVTLSQAKTIVARFGGVITQQGSDLGDANTTAQAILAGGYTEYSDSVLSLEQAPVRPRSLRIWIYSR